MDRDLVQALLLILVLGLLVLAFRSYDEGFTGATPCGVDKAPCSADLKCVNGFCARTEPTRLYEKEPVKMLPDGQGAPAL